MEGTPEVFRDRGVNGLRYRKGQMEGHYESFFLRGNHPRNPLAFWIRYTLFTPRGRPGEALGELWATFFDGERGRHVSVKEELPLAACRFDEDRFHIAIGTALLDQGKASGSASRGGDRIDWDLTYGGTSPPLYLLPPALYRGGFPKAKSLVPLPLARFSGTLTVNGDPIPLDTWTGSQNHNWGVKHTDHYAWGQVAGFDGSPESFFEIGTARLRIGPLWTPFMTLMVLRHRGKEYALNGILRSIRAQGSFEYFRWNFASENESVKIQGTMAADGSSFVGLRYYNPPGGIKHCLNTKIASCTLSITTKGGGSPVTEVLGTASRAAFEILTDDRSHGVRLYA